jgi:hypothetical protein
MQCYLIDPSAKTVVSVELDGGLAGIRKLIGFDSIDSDEAGSEGDRLYFDESCFIRQQPGAGRFKLDTLAPVAGMGVVVGTTSGKELATPRASLDAIRGRVQFL